MGVAMAAGLFVALLMGVLLVRGDLASLAAGRDGGGGGRRRSHPADRRTARMKPAS
jgi:hypothetical protein